MEWAVIFVGLALLGLIAYGVLSIAGHLRRVADALQLVWNETGGWNVHGQGHVRVRMERDD